METRRGFIQKTFATLGLAASGCTLIDRVERGALPERAGGMQEWLNAVPYEIDAQFVDGNVRVTVDTSMFAGDVRVTAWNSEYGADEDPMHYPQVQTINPNTVDIAIEQEVDRLEVRVESPDGSVGITAHLFLQPADKSKNPYYMVSFKYPQVRDGEKYYRILWSGLERELRGMKHSGE